MDRGRVGSGARRPPSGTRGALTGDRRQACPACPSLMYRERKCLPDSRSSFILSLSTHRTAGILLRAGNTFRRLPAGPYSQEGFRLLLKGSNLDSCPLRESVDCEINPHPVAQGCCEKLVRWCRVSTVNYKEIGQISGRFDCGHMRATQLPDRRERRAQGPSGELPASEGESLAEHKPWRAQAHPQEQGARCPTGFRRLAEAALLTGVCTLQKETILSGT